VWGAISFYDKSPLKIYDKTVSFIGHDGKKRRKKETVTHESYFETLKSHFTDFTSNLFPVNPNPLAPFRVQIFMHDNAPPHTKAEEKIKTELKLNILENWPPSSPDLSPIENIWGWMQQKLRKCNITKKHELIACIQMLWFQYKQIWIMKAIHDMPLRLLQVISCSGQKIKY
jgi:hypothetical protein